MADMRTIEQQRESYIEKTAVLVDLFGDSVTPYDFYRSIYPEGFLQERGSEHFRDGKTVAIANAKHTRKRDGGSYRKNHIMTNELDVVGKYKNYEIFLSPVSFVGGKKDLDHVRYIHAFAIDLDYVDSPQILALAHQINIGFIPRPTYIVNSGTGLHLYYLLEEPYRVYSVDEKVKQGLRSLKFAIIEQAWNEETSLDNEKHQHQGIIQQHRMVGSRCKASLGKEFEVLAFNSGGGRWTVDKLLDFKSLGTGEWGKYSEYAEEARKLIYHQRYDQLTGKKKLTLKEAKERYPEWYEQRILKGEPPIPIEKRGKWHVHPRVYEWWLRKIKQEAYDGNRYYCLFCLGIYAIKCDIPYERFEKDCWELKEVFDALTTDETNHFVDDDVRAALLIYNNKSYYTLPIPSIEYFSKLDIPRNARNLDDKKEYEKYLGRRCTSREWQKVHLEEKARYERDRKWKRKEGNWWDGGGRPKGSGTKKDIVLEYSSQHPDATPTEIARNCGVSRPTVYKWLKQDNQE